jgi:lipopolysaccharide assembly outer membrane protein LptD (OstA)
MTQPDPSVKRQTGLLIPSIGSTSRLGFFTSIPYYIVINNSSDITLTPIIAVKTGPVLDANYRKAFNDGNLDIDISGGRDSEGGGTNSFGNAIFSSGTFDLNQNWRAGFSYNHASNPNYLDDYKTRRSCPAAPIWKASGKAPTASWKSTAIRAWSPALPRAPCRSCCLTGNMISNPIRISGAAASASAPMPSMSSAVSAPTPAAPR